MKKHTAKTVTAHGNGSNSEVDRNVRPRGSKHDANLRKRGAQRFQVGLILAMLLVYVGLEASFRSMKVDAVEPEREITETTEYYPELAYLEIEIPKSDDLPPPVRVSDPTEFKVVDDDAVIEVAKEFVDVPATPAPDLNLSEIEVAKEDTPSLDIPFIVVEDVPIFPGCEKVEKSERRSCFNEKMKKHIKRNFRYPEPAQEMGLEGRVNIIFKIDVDGSITDVRMRGPEKILEKEAARIIGKLPKMIPGKQRGEPVRVPFSIPITFKLSH